MDFRPQVRSLGGASLDGAATSSDATQRMRYLLVAAAWSVTDPAALDAPADGTNDVRAALSGVSAEVHKRRITDCGRA